ncbi:MAG: diacylglycerol kinase family protein [Candidatus Hydrogenedentota bacterium]
MKLGLFSPRARVASFRHAFRGIVALFCTQPNVWLHALATVMVVFAGFLCRLSRFEWLWVVAAICAVWTAEALNTALEFLADAVSTDHHPRIGKAKDVAAAAVLVAAGGAAVIGAIIFWPHLRSWLF